jgi:hypothetical protein
MKLQQQQQQQQFMEIKNLQRDVSSYKGKIDRSTCAHKTHQQEENCNDNNSKNNSGVVVVV